MGLLVAFACGASGGGLRVWGFWRWLASSRVATWRRSCSVGIPHTWQSSESGRLRGRRPRKTHRKIHGRTARPLAGKPRADPPRRQAWGRLGGELSWPGRLGGELNWPGRLGGEAGPARTAGGEAGPDGAAGRASGGCSGVVLKGQAIGGLMRYSCEIGWGAFAGAAQSVRFLVPKRGADALRAAIIRHFSL